MSKRLAEAIAATLIIGATLSLTAPAAATEAWRYDECRFQGANGHAGFQLHEIKHTVRCAADRFDVSAGLALDIIWRESRFNPYAVNASSGACSLLQFYPASSFFTRYGRLVDGRPRFRPLQRECSNARSAILAGLWEARVYGWSAWGY